MTYSFQPNFGRTTNPILPKVERVRTDVSWEDVIRQHIQAAPIAQILNGMQEERERKERSGCRRDGEVMEGEARARRRKESG